MSEVRNPYGDDLGNRDARLSLHETPTAIAEIVRRLGADGFSRRTAPGKWTLAEILVHLAQTEIVVQGRLRYALATEGYLVQPFDQDAFMAVEPAVDGNAALAAYVSMRTFTLPLIDRLTPHELAKRFRHPDHGEISVTWLLAWWAGHERRHLGQIEQIAAQG
jgi:DinB family protein